MGTLIVFLAKRKKKTFLLFSYIILSSGVENKEMLCLQGALGA